MKRRAPAVDSDGPRLRTEVTVLSDLSANVFAALLLILIVLLQVKALATQARAPDTATVEAERDLGATPHRPLSASGIVSLLQRRGAGAAGLSIDLADRGLGLVWGGREADVPAADLAALDAALADLDPSGGPVRLYVFSNALYPRVVDRLKRSGAAFEELSVPAALRSFADAGRWSPGFLSLVGRRADAAAFRAELARLLARSPEPLRPGGHVAGAGGTGAEAPSGAAGAPARPLLERLLAALGAALGASALLCGLAVVALTQRLVPHRALAYRDPRGVRQGLGSGAGRADDPS